MQDSLEWKGEMSKKDDLFSKFIIFMNFRFIRDVLSCDRPYVDTLVINNLGYLQLCSKIMNRYQQ